MKIYFAGVPGGALKGEKNLVKKIPQLFTRLFSYYFCKNNEFSNMDILNLWIKRRESDNYYKNI